MTRKSSFHVVGPDSPKPPALTISQAAEGSQRDLLVAMRSRIAKAVEADDCPPRDLASLTRRLQEINKEIAALDLRAKEEGADADDVAADEKWEAEAL